MPEWLLIPSLLWLISALVFGLLCSWVAREKGRSEGAWLLLGASLGIIALIALAAVPVVKRAGLDDEVSTCPRCGNRALDEYRRPDGLYDCGGCGAVFRPEHPHAT